MAMTTESHTAQIGEAAGVVWRALDTHGSLTLAKLVKETDLPRDLVMQAVGWLARGEKLDFDDSRTRKVTLRN